MSSGSFHERKIVTTDLKKGCTEGHTGTSASAPIGQFFYLVTNFCEVSKSHDGQIFVVMLIFSVCVCTQENQSLVQSGEYHR